MHTELPWGLSPGGCREGAGAIAEPIAVAGSGERTCWRPRVEGVISAGDSVVRRSFRHRTLPGRAVVCRRGLSVDR